MHVVGQSPAHLALDDGKAVLLESLLGVLQLLELDEREVKVLEQRSNSKGEGSVDVYAKTCLRVTECKKSVTYLLIAIWQEPTRDS